MDNDNNGGPGFVWTGGYTPGDDAAPVLEAPGGQMQVFGSTSVLPHVPLASLALIVVVLLALEHMRAKAARRKRS